MNPQPRSPRAAAHKVSELSALEQRLHSAAFRAQQSGFPTRSASYLRQLKAVRQEREHWSLLLNNPTAPIPTPHLLAGLLALILPLVEFFIAGGVAAKRLARVVFTIGLVVCAVVIGTSPPSTWACSSSELGTPMHWVTEIARAELPRKNEVRPLPVHPLSGRALWTAS